MKATIAALTALLALAGCTRAEAPRPSIQDIMAGKVDPAADALWESVSSETTQNGIEEKQPRSDAEWQAVRSHAVALIDAGKLLAAAELPVTHGGRKVEDAHVPGVLAAADVEQAIRKDRAGFEARARDLQEAAGQALAAIDARKPARLLAAGGNIDKACKRCHVAYWYPNAAAPEVKWPAPLKAAGHP
jgi:hypothetical protein